MSCLACSTILWQKWVLHTTIQPFSFSLYQCNTHIYILDKATEGFFHILLIASAHFGFNLFWKTICGKCLWMHEWNNHRKQKSCLCQFTLLTATDRRHPVVPQRLEVSRALHPHHHNTTTKKGWFWHLYTGTCHELLLWNLISQKA